MLGQFLFLVYDASSRAKLARFLLIFYYFCIHLQELEKKGKERQKKVFLVLQIPSPAANFTKHFLP
jgi:hypothetical protein